MYLYTLLNQKQAAAFRSFSLPQHERFLEDVAFGPDSKVLAIGAHAMNIPFGFAMASIGARDDPAELIALFVREKHRRHRVATEMLTRLERELSQRGCRELRALYELERPYSETLGIFLDSAGFSPPIKYAVSCRCLFDRMREAPWLDRTRVPAAFELFPWTDLTEQEERTIVESQDEAPWFPEDLSPFAAGDFEPLNSLGLRYEGEVVGWQINHRIAQDTIQYSITFVREDLQSLGLGVLLMVESSRLHVHNPDPGLNKAYFRVPFAMTGMIQYIESRLAPFIDERNDSVSTTKVLDVTDS